MTKFNLFKFALIIIAIVGFAVAFINDGISSHGGVHYNHRVAVLEYHHIDPQASDYTLTPENFEKDLEILKSNHYRVIPMEEFIGFLRGENDVPPDAVVITFDDGYESFYRYAYPILKKHGMVATNFVIVSYLGTNPGIPFLTWDEIIGMKKDGFSFYSHTYSSHDFAADQNGKLVDPLTNPIYSQTLKRMETNKEYKQRVIEDLDQANNIMQSRLGIQDKLLCLPHGRYNQTLLSLAKQEGFSYIFGGEDGLNDRGTQLIRRVNAGSASPNTFIRKLNDETTVLGNAKILLKNMIQRNRMAE